jgi:hypothetical protein
VYLFVFVAGKVIIYLVFFLFTSFFIIIITTEIKVEKSCRIQNNYIDNLSISMTSPAAPTQTLPPPSYNQYQQQQQDSIDQINEITPQPTAPPTYNSIVNKA